MTSVCVTCVGRRCDKCKVGFFSLNTANADGCEPCNCDASKSLSAVCDRETGQCPCKPHVHGRQCSSCELGYYWSTSQCLACDDHCSRVGTLPASTCHSTTGQCVCKRYVIGRSCDTCRDGYYGLVSVTAIQLRLLVSYRSQYTSIIGACLLYDRQIVTVFQITFLIVKVKFSAPLRMPT